MFSSRNAKYIAQAWHHHGHIPVGGGAITQLAVDVASPAAGSAITYNCTCVVLSS
jgi:hypothetical protein